MDKNREFLRSSKDGWSVKFELPDDFNVVWPDKINKISFKDGLCSQNQLSMTELNNSRLVNKIKDDVNKLDITFSDNLDAYNSMLKIAYDSFKPELDGFLKFFEFDEKHSTDDHASYVLKKPLNELTEEEKTELKEICAKFEITDLSNWNL